MKIARVSSLQVLLSMLVFSGSVSALTPLTENFNASKLNAKRWNLTNGGAGKLAQSKSTLSFTVGAKPSGDDFGIIELKNNQPGYNESWEVIADVVNKTQLGSKAGVVVQVVNANDRKDILALEFYGTGPQGGFVAIGIVDDHDDPRKDVRKKSGAASGSVRISFDKTTKVFTLWYDETGRSDGYQWTELTTYSTTGKGGARGGNWKMNPASGRFVVQLAAFSEGKTVAKGKLSIDNFSLKARP